MAYEGGLDEVSRDVSEAFDVLDGELGLVDVVGWVRGEVRMHSSE